MKNNFVDQITRRHCGEGWISQNTCKRVKREEDTHFRSEVEPYVTLLETILDLLAQGQEYQSLFKKCIKKRDERVTALQRTCEATSNRASVAYSISGSRRGENSQ